MAVWRRHPNTRVKIHSNKDSQFGSDECKRWCKDNHLVAVASKAVLARQILMQAINAATDVGGQKRFKCPHGLSMVIKLGHIVVTGWLLAIIV